MANLNCYAKLSITRTHFFPLQKQQTKHSMEKKNVEDNSHSAVIHIAV